jgi:hypothetical protein
MVWVSVNTSINIIEKEIKILFQMIIGDYIYV